MKRLLLLAILLLVMRTDLFSESFPASKPNNDTIILDRDGLTFRRISPRQLGTNSGDFFLLETEVTNEQYERYLKATGRDKGDSDLVAAERAREEAERKSGKYSFNSHSPVYDFSNPSLLWTSNTPPKGRGNHPVGLITIADARTFCEWLTSRYRSIGLFRLPSVDEWLLAAYGAKRNYPWGDEWSFGIPCVSKSEKARRTTTEPVKAHARDRTPEGIYGLCGNVAEYVTESKPEPRWMGPSFKSHPIKGEGLFPFTPRNDWWGYAHNAGSRGEGIGFRVLLEPHEAHNKNGAANRSQPVSSRINRTSTAAGSGR